MNDLCMIIKEVVKPNFLNIRTAIQTYNRDAICYGAPCWRWVYHALHSADKWFINPFDYEEPEFHVEGMDDPEKHLNRTGYAHIAFSVGSKEKVDALTERLQTEGYKVVSGPRTTGDGYYESCIIAVEGNQIEITE